MQSFIQWAAEQLVLISGLLVVIAALVFFGSTARLLFRAWNQWLHEQLNIKEGDDDGTLS